MDERLQCFDSACVFMATRTATGMHTNGGCKCLYDLGIRPPVSAQLRQAIRAAIQAAHDLHEKRQPLLPRVEP